ncbi:MAG: Zn-ribbon domain-containing OB-fold protein [Myxococcales bacterium]|nr:Zn-ribbon domain-containing OB-fold protein [Myxococcales bacterium]
MDDKARPLPTPTSVSRRYWDSVNAEALTIPRCRDCGAVHFYPHALCVSCMSPNLDYIPVSGNGTVYTYTVIRSPQPAFRGMEPYVVANVELDEGVRMMANVITDDPDSVGIGTRVRLVYQPVTPDQKMPQFEKA